MKVVDSIKNKLFIYLVIFFFQSINGSNHKIICMNEKKKKKERTEQIVEEDGRKKLARISSKYTQNIQWLCIAIYWLFVITKQTKRFVSCLS